MIDDTFMDNVEVEKFVYEFVVDKFTENSPSDHLERKDRDEFLGFDDQFSILLIPDDMGEARQGLESFVGIVDHDGEKFGDFLWGEVWIDMGSETSSVSIMLYTDGMAEDSAHVLSKANIGDLEVDLGITVVVSTGVIGISKNAFNRLFQRKPRKPCLASRSQLRDITAEYSVQGTVLSAVFGHHTGSLE